MASNNAGRKPAKVDAPFGRVSLDWVSQWQKAGLSRTAISVMTCFASSLYTDESGQIYTWFPVNEMAKRLGVTERTIFKAVGSAKQRGFLKEKKRACYRRCTEYWFMPNRGTLNQPKEKALTVAAANAGETGCALSFFNEPQTSDPIIPVQSIEHVESGRYLPASGSRSESKKPVSTHTSMEREQYEALINDGAFKIGNWNA